MNPGTTSLALAPSNARGLQMTSLDDMMRFANVVIKSGLAPTSFDTPEKVVIALVTGSELGISAMQSLQGLAVTNGRIGIMGDLALALCEATPECEDVIEEWSGQELADDWTCTITAKRKGREPRTGSFSVREAKVARLWGKTSREGKPSPWITYPKRMLRYRALGFALRDAFPDVLKGVKTVEELQDYPDEAKPGFQHAKPAEARVVEEAVKPSEETTAAQPTNGNGNGHTTADPLDAVPLQGIASDYEVKDSSGKTYHAVTVGEHKVYTTDAGSGHALEGLVGFRASVLATPAHKPGLYRFVAIQDVERDPKPEATTQPAAAAEPERKDLVNPGNTVGVARQKAREAARERFAQQGVKPQTKVSEAPEQPFVGTIESVWRQGEIYVARVNGIHLQTREAAAGEKLLAMEGKTLRAVVRPGTQPSQMHLVRIEESELPEGPTEEAASPNPAA